MRKLVCVVVAIAVGVLALQSAMAYRLFDPGNELHNGDFETGEPGAPPVGWEANAQEIAVAAGGGNPGQNVFCIGPTYDPQTEEPAWGSRIRQLADESLVWVGDEQSPNPYWNDVLRKKVLMLSLDISADLAGAQGPVGVRVRFDVWSMKWNDPAYNLGNLPANPIEGRDFHYTDWFVLDDLSAQWQARAVKLYLPDTQPRFVSVEIEFMQPTGVQIFVDNVIMTGMCVPDVASLGDLVWHDLNQDGKQDTGEPGIDGVPVNLYGASGFLVDSTVTAGGGLYGFTNLPPGDYFVEFKPPPGYSYSPQDAGTDDTIDSDADPTTGRTVVTTLDPGEHDPTWDLGLYRPALPAAIGDLVWYDSNRNGIQDAGEVGIDGATVKLYDGAGNLVATTTTAGGGIYSFTGLTPGDYYIEFTLPAGYDGFSPQDQGIDDAKDSDADTTTGKAAATTLVSGENDLTWDAGVYKSEPPKIDIEKYVKGETAPPEGNLCGELGKPQKLTMLYTAHNNTNHTQDPAKVTITGDPNGASPVYIVATDKKGSRVWAQGTVALDGTFDIDATSAGKTRLDAETYVRIYTAQGGTLLSTVRFHTSCSQPLQLGNQFGSIKIVGFLSDTGGTATLDESSDDDFGDDADEPTGPEFALGDTVVWTYVVTNPGQAPLTNIVVTDDKESPAPILDGGFNVGDVDHNNILEPGEEWLYRATGIAEVAGQYRNIGTVVGTPVGGGDNVTDSDPAHYIVPVPQVNLCGEYGKPQRLRMRYVGGNEQHHEQDDGKVVVTGDPANASPVRIIAASKSDPSNKKAKVWFDGQVALGNTFDIDARNAGATRLAGDTYVFVYDLAGNLLQSVKFHTSCSQPLRIGDQFGSVEIVGFLSENGTGFPSDGPGDDPGDDPGPNVVTATIDGEPVDCCLTIGELTVKRKAAVVKVTNNLDERVTIRAITITWPSPNGQLEKIKLGKDTIYEQASAPPTLVVDSGWKGTEGQRSIDPGSTKEIKLEFEQNASAAGHVIQIDFVTPADL